MTEYDSLTMVYGGYLEMDIKVSGRCRSNLYFTKHRIIKTKSRGYRCKYCDKPLSVLRKEKKGKKR